MRHVNSLFSRAVDWRGVCAVLVVALFDVATGDAVRFLPAYAIGPAVSTVRGTPGTVVGTGAVAALAAALLALDDGILATRRGLSSLAVIVLFTGFAAAVAGHRRRHERRLTASRRVAWAAQHAIAPPLPVAHGPVRLAASYESAEPEATIGGDLCEAIPVKNGVRVLIGDIQGKGLGAVELSTALRGAFRESAPYATRMEDVGLRMACAMLRRPDEERFATLVLAELTSQGTLTVLNYGHPSPLVVRADGTPEWADPAEPGLPLGLAALFDGEPGRHCTTLGRGDRVLFHTDGLTEARDGRGLFYPLVERAALLRDAPLERSLERLRTDARIHAARAHGDDSALLLVEFGGRPPAESPPPANSAVRVRTPHSVTSLGCDVCAVAPCPLRDALLGPDSPGRRSADPA